LPPMLASSVCSIRVYSLKVWYPKFPRLARKP
jgi:hypothetical protein